MAALTPQDVTFDSDGAGNTALRQGSLRVAIFSGIGEAELRAGDLDWLANLSPSEGV